MVEHTNYFNGPLEASVAAASVLVVAMLALLLLVHRRWWTPSGGVGVGLACCQDVGMRRRLPPVAHLAETGGSPNSAQPTLPPAPLLLAASSDLGSVYSGEECSDEENRRRMEIEATLLEGGNGSYMFHPAFHWQMQLQAQCRQPLQPLNGQMHQSARARHSHHHYRQTVADASLAEKGAVGVCISSSGSTSSEDDKALRHRENRANSWNGYAPIQRMPPPPPLRKHTLEIMEAPLEEPNNTDCVVEMHQEVGSGPSRCGQIEVAFAYDAPIRKMTVHLLQARVPLSSSGSSVSANRNSSGPHLQVRLLLLPNRKQKHKSRVRHGENPQFMESFLLHRINPEDVNSMGVRFRLYLCERMRRERLGECVVRFSSVCLEAENNVWLELEPRASSALKMSACDVLSLARSDSTSSSHSVAPHLVGSCQSGSCQMILPEIFLGLAYNGTTGRLAVELIKGSHLRNLAMTRAPDTYVKLSLLSSTDHELSRSKSSIRRGQPNPLFKETFIFQVALFQLPDVTLMVSVYNKRGIQKKELIGWFSLGLKSSGEAARRHWDEMCEMRGEQLCRWHTLLDC